MKWKDKLINDIILALDEIQDALNLKELIMNDRANVHLAVFSEPYLTLILNGSKTIDSRFSIKKTIPYGKVLPQDIVLLKKSGSHIIGIFTVYETIFLSNLNEDKINEINTVYGKESLWNADPHFLSTKKDSNFLTLIKIKYVIKINPIICDKADRTGWSIVKLGFNNTLFENI